jgi:hypothetical protein
VGRVVQGICASLLVSVALLAPAAAAQPGAPASAQDEAHRTQLYKQAVEMANAGRWADALPKLQAVLALRSSPKVRFTLGQAQEHVGQLAAAYETYGRVAADATAAGEGDVASLASSAQHAIEPRVPSLRVVVSGANADGASATIDDRAVQAGQPVRVDPGPHKVVATDAGGRATTANVTVRERDHVDVPLRLEGPSSATATPPVPAVDGASPPPQPAPNEQPTAESPSSGLGGVRIAALTAGGAGVVALGIGAYFGFDAISKNNASNAAGCDGSTAVCSNQGAYDTRESAKSSATVSTVAFVAGGVLLAGGLTLWLVAPHRETAVQIAPTAFAGGAGLTAGGVWR